MKWSKNLDEILIKYIKDGMSYDEISLKLNTSNRSVRSRCFRLKIKSSDYKIPIINKCFCLNCKNEIIDNVERKFCSHKCSAIYNNKLRKDGRTCLCCNKQIDKWRKYCSSKCQRLYEYKNYISKWKNGEVDGMKGPDNLSNYVRKYIFEKFNNKCCECGWSIINKHTNKIPLQIDHIDGNYKNNDEKNLRLICPNCHSLTENYGSRNTGNGREYRQSWRKKKREM
jgi:predicted nucleic acid-binding Zn ribbon protein